MKTAILLWALCQGLDSTTTAIAMQRGYREANVALGNRLPVILSIKLTGNLVSWGVHRRVRDRYPNVVPAIMATSGCAAASWNIYQLNRR